MLIDRLTISYNTIQHYTKIFMTQLSNFTIRLFVNLELFLLFMKIVFKLSFVNNISHHHPKIL